MATLAEVSVQLIHIRDSLRLVCRVSGRTLTLSTVSVRMTVAVS